MINRCPPRLQEKFVKNFTFARRPRKWQFLPPGTGQKATIICQNPASRHRPFPGGYRTTAPPNCMALDVRKHCADFTTTECRAGPGDAPPAGDAVRHRHVPAGRGLFSPEDG